MYVLFLKSLCLHFFFLRRYSSSCPSFSEDIVLFVLFHSLLVFISPPLHFLSSLVWFFPSLSLPISVSHCLCVCLLFFRSSSVSLVLVLNFFFHYLLHYHLYRHTPRQLFRDLFCCDSFDSPFNHTLANT